MSLSIRHSKQSPSTDMKLRCYTCLSLDRNLKLLKHEQKCLLGMLCPEMFSKAKHNSHYLICWECEFMIAKIKRFQARLMKAHLRITITLQGVKTVVEGLSTLKITGVETINITPQAPQNIPTNQNQQILIEIPHPHPTTPAPLKVEPETIKIEVEEEEKCAGEISGVFDELIQPTKIQQASSDESTDTASESDMYDDPLMTQKQKKPKSIMKCAEIAVSPQKAKLNYIPRVFINAPEEKLALRGNREAVTVTGGVPNLGTRKESAPILVKSKGVSFVVKDEGSLPIAVKNERRVPMLVKSKGRVSVVLKGKGRSVPNRLKGKGRSVSNRVKAPTLAKQEELILKRQIGPNNSNLRRVSQPKQPQQRETGCEQIPGIYGYDEYEVKCVILNRTELNTFRDKQRRKIGYKGHGYNCDRCVEKFMTQKNLDEHNKKHDKSRGNSICELCEQRFPNDGDRDEHYKQHFIIFECLQCPYQNTDRLKISEHIRRNHEVSLFDCKKCDAFFKTYKEKRKHRLEVHSRRQRCEECNKTFTTLQLLKTHKATHERETTDCPVCQKKVRKNYLEKHIKIHNDTGEDSVYCVDCDKNYKDQKSYNRHLKTSLKHNTVEKVGIKCDHCNKYFKGSTALKNHLEEVSGVKYTCDICKKDSKNKVILARHIRFVHKGQKPQHKPKICEYCGKTFFIKKSLLQHINKHLGYRPLVCKDCGATFIYSAALFTHRRLVHKVKRRYEMPS